MIFAHNSASAGFDYPQKRKSKRGFPYDHIGECFPKDVELVSHQNLFFQPAGLLETCRTRERRFTDHTNFFTRVRGKRDTVENWWELGSISNDQIFNDERPIT